MKVYGIPQNGTHEMIMYPVTQTKISTANWGIPVTDAINALQAFQDANKPTPWVNATLQNGWVAAASGGIQYRKAADVVSVRGRVDFPGGGNGPAWVPIFTLPTGFRPSVSIFIVTAIVLNAAWATNVLEVNSAGQVNTMFNGQSVAPTFSFSNL